MDDATPAAPSPGWVRAAWKQTREELESFVRTVLAFSVHPLGLLAHGVFRLFGSKRLLRDSLATAPYATGPTVAAQTLDSTAAALYFSLFGHSVAVLREVHDAGRCPFVRAIGAFAAALLVSAFANSGKKEASRPPAF